MKCFGNDLGCFRSINVFVGVSKNMQMLKRTF